MNGYLHTEYAQSLSEFGTPIELPLSHGWILERQISKVPFRDAMGCYPFFSCLNWKQLHIDLESLRNDLVAVSMVTDPFGEYDPKYLRSCFPDVLIPYKEHFIIDLRRKMDSFISKHHRRYASKALKIVSIEKCDQPINYLEDWIGLYNNLVQRHQIKGVSAFSEMAFAIQLKIPGIVVFRAVFEGETIGMLLWFEQGKIGYYHLGAYNSRGYEMRASHALFWSAIEYFALKGLKWLSLGAGAGSIGNVKDGLSRFKQGWSTGTKTAYFCGRILNIEKYYEAVKVKNNVGSDYFPAYREGEFSKNS